MIKIGIITLLLIVNVLVASSQSNQAYTLKAGIAMQQTQYLYNENGIGVDFSTSKLLNNKLHLKAEILSSRLGFGNGVNALKQENFILGAQYHFLSDKNLQILAGVNTGLFLVDYESVVFNVLPNSSLMFSVEAGVHYKIPNSPVSASLTVGYNLINGNGVNIPGSLFPVFYKLGVFYPIENLFCKK